MAIDPNAPLQGYVAGPQKPQAPQYTYDNQFKDDAGYQNRMAYGGYAGGAEDATQRYQGLGGAAANRAAYQADYGAYDQDRANAGGARDAQLDALSLQRGAANGTAPSRAEILGRRMVGESLDAQMAAAASAKGGSLAQAAAGRYAADQANTFRQRSMSDIEAQRAMEMEHARDAYQAGATGIRSGDYTGAGVALQKSGQDIQNEQFQRGQNQQAQEYYEGLGNDVSQTQLQANIQNQAINNNQSAGNIQAGAHSSDFGFQKAATIAGAAAGGVGTGAAGLLPKAEGGPIHGSGPGAVFANLGMGTEKGLGKFMPSTSTVIAPIGQMTATAVPSLQRARPAMPAMPTRAAGGPTAARPYLVGEQGPELVLPRNDGYVMTAQQTAALLGAPPTAQQTEYLESRGLAHAADVRARAFGGPMLPGGAPDPMLESQGGLGWTRAGYSPANQYAEQNAQMMQVARHPSGMASFAREEGGPVESAAHRAGEVAVKMAAPVSLSAAPHVISSATGLAQAALNRQGDSAGGDRVGRAVEAVREATPHSIADVRAHVNSAIDRVTGRRAMGGPVSGLGRAAAMRRCA